MPLQWTLMRFIVAAVGWIVLMVAAAWLRMRSSVRTRKFWLWLPTRELRDV